MPFRKSRHHEGIPSMAAVPASAPPKITSVTYSPNPATAGQEVTATVQYTAGTSLVTFQGTGVVKDQVTGTTVPATAAFQVQTPDSTSAAGFTDTGNHTWVPVSDSGGVAVYNTTA